ncbi:excinuclease ABC subunit UvrB [Stenotrophomonas maltophilia]|uniref:excinuclease ABC subunit UvrB n=1 Tax=Stenotrophomonas maltophilia TaxID=40324 RepID=UPI0013DCDB90|nr:excinuclease ABC subunit UvrB [Stenotrophomonas maltophilia]
MSTDMFVMHSDHTPAGDQPEAIARLIAGIEEGATHQTLKGITGSGKTFTMANVIHRLKRPTLILAPNKTLTAQLYGEMKALFPENAVEYFVSYYDFFQPEVYIPGSDRYIQKDSAINDHLERLRLSTTKSLIERRDVIVVASVSSIYGLGDPQSYRDLQVELALGIELDQRDFLRRLASLQYDRTERTLKRGTFRVSGDVVDIFPADSEYKAIRVELTDEGRVQSLIWIDAVTGKKLGDETRYLVSPKTLFASPKTEINEATKAILKDLEARVAELNASGRIVEANRLYEKITNDVEMMRELGYCSGMENYSSYLNSKPSGARPTTLMDYLPKDGLLFVDESHVMVPQIAAMFRSDQSRKETLIEYGFRLPSAMNNRPLSFSEFEAIKPQTIFVSATPGAYEIGRSKGRSIDQLIRPTGLLDPLVEVRPREGYRCDLLSEIARCVREGDRVLVTTLTKVSAEELCEFLEDQGVRAKYMHSDIKAEDRVEIINGLRAGEFDVLVGISLLREGLDIPEASLVAIVDADQAGFLRSSQALIQMIGRAARNSRGKAIMYADTITSAMRQAISETDDRRQHQIAFNEEFGITPSTSRGMLGSTEARPDRSHAHSAEFCASLKDLCDRITSKERQLLDLSDAGDEEEIEFVRLELDKLYRQFIYM